jgi:hypothetical protein
LIHGSSIEIALKSQIVTEGRMNHRRVRIKRSEHVRNRREFFVVHRHGFGSILGERAAGRNNRRNRLTLPACAIHCDRVLRSRLEAFQMRQHTDPRRNHIRQFGTGLPRQSRRAWPSLWPSIFRILA